MLGGSIFCFYQSGGGVAASAPDSCLHYAGYASIEGKYGSDRHLGEAELFLPVACTEKALLFADLRMRGDNRSGREGNVALGVRSLQEHGIAGGYVYFDRLRSGETEKMHSQLTFGVEWLAQTLEVRGNAYLPVTGEKQIETAPSVAASDPFLNNGGIFVRTSGNQILREEPMYGMDTEAGFKLPDADFWMHVGGFAFDAEDAPSMRGVRARARLDVTENVSLSAEGQYDNQRGRQGWVGVRLSVPFGGSAQKPQGLKARMTVPPVRDVDIVTAAAETRSQSKTVPVINIETGEAQRVLHVDNVAAPGGDGTLENPFNTLAAAEAAMQAHDVIYVHAGNGTSVGQNQGITLGQTGVLMIGSGTDFIYDVGRFTTSAQGRLNGTIIADATSAPIITNNAGSGISVTADDVEIAGVTVNGATAHGIYAQNNTGATWERASVHDVTLMNNAFTGLLLQSTGAGSSIANASVSDVTATGNVQRGAYLQADTGGEITAVTLSNISATANTMQGIYVLASGGGQIDAITLEDITGSGNTGAGLEINSSGAGSAITNATATNVTTTGNAQQGIYVLSDTSGQIATTSLTGVTSSGNANRGVLILASGNGDIGTMTLDDITSTSNTGAGVQIYALGTGSTLTNASLNNITSNSNTSRGVYTLAETDGDIGTVMLDDITSNSNGSVGFQITSTGAGSTITDITATNVTSTGNAAQGVYVLAQTGAQIGAATLDEITSANNTGASGARLLINASGANSLITNATATNVTTTGNALRGVHIQATGQIGTATLENVESNHNSNQGVYAVAVGAGKITSLALDNITSSENTTRGMDIQADGLNSAITSITASNLTTEKNTTQGIYVNVLNNGQIGTATLEHITSTQNTAQGVYVEVFSTGGQIGTATLNDVTASSNNNIGVHFRTTGANSSITNATATNITANSNTAQGVYVLAQTAGDIGALTLDGITANNNTGASGTGLQVLATAAGSTITTATISDVTTNANSLYGTYVAAQAAGLISATTLDEITTNNNIGASGRGLYLQSDGAGSAITNSTISNVTANGNAQRGVYVTANVGSLSASLQSVTASGNAGNGIFIDDDTAAAFTADLGGGALASPGQNRFFGNTGTDIFVDMDGLQLKAENNWWGNAAGLLPARVTLDGASTIDATPFLAVDPNP